MIPRTATKTAERLALGFPIVAITGPRQFLSERNERCLTPMALSGFRGITGTVTCHHRIIVGSGRAAVQHPEFRWVNTILGNLKTAITGTYHAFDFAKYAYRYLAEVQYRFNRRFDLRAILGRLAHAAAATAPWPERKIGLAEVHR